MDKPAPGASDEQAHRRISELEQTISSLREDSEVAHVLLGLAGVLAELRTVEETLEMAVRVVPDIMGADRCFAATRVGAEQGYRLLAHGGFEGEQLHQLEENASKPQGFPILDAALEERQPLLLDPSSEDPRTELLGLHSQGLSASICLPLARWGEEFGGVVLEFDAARTFGTKELALARGIARQIGQALVNARRFNLLSDLREFGQRIAPKLSMGDVINNVAHSAVELLSGDAGGIYFFDSTTERLLGPPAGLVGERLSVPRQIDLKDARWAPLAGGMTLHVQEAFTADGSTWSVAAAPVIGSRSVLAGAIVVFFRRSFSLAADEMEALSVLAAQAALSLENARRFEREMQRARSLQKGLLTPLPKLTGCEIAAVYDPASGESEIGGDFYDAFELPDGRVGVVVGDVSGKGAEAAARLATAKYMLRAFALRNPVPSSVLFHLNNALVHDLEEERFATLAYGLLDPSAHEATFGIAGHPPPLLYRAATGELETIELPGAILGAFQDVNYEQQTFSLSPGDYFVAFTDGLVEARSADGQFYGRRPVEAGLKEHAPNMTAQQLAERLLEDAKVFGTLNDDTVVLTLRCGETPS
jgi:serine phosphatase RsbU (regulator of sigma subunit)